MGQNLSATTSPSLPYVPGREVCRLNDSWVLMEGEESGGSKKPVSIFVVSESSGLLSNYVRRIKTLRHPNLLPFLHSAEIVDPTTKMTRTYIVTERVEPLSLKLNNEIIQPNKDNDIIAWGLYEIARAISFLNKDCNLVHGNISPSSVFVTQSGDWKLGGFEFVSQIDDVRNKRSCPLIDYLCGQRNPRTECLQLPPELSQPQASFEDLPVSAIDSWELGVLIYHIYNFHSIRRPFDKQSLKDMNKLPQALRDEYMKMLSGSPRVRLLPDRFMESPFFTENQFVQTCLFLEHITIKDNFEKDKFFRKLPKLIDSFPEFYCKRKILPHLVSALDFGGVNSLVLPPLLRIASTLTENEYRSQIMPSVVKWFQSPDRALRVALLQNLKPLIQHLDTNTASKDIFPHLAHGFLDTSPQLRELTVISTVQFVPLLNPSIVNGDLLKYLAKVQVDPQPGVRYNTTVALGKIAKYLTPQTREKVLIPAFTRALRDEYIPSRRAGLAAILVTHTGVEADESGTAKATGDKDFKSFYTPADVAHRLIPAVAPMALDLDPIVRRLAMSNLTNFVEYLRAQQPALDAQAQAQQQREQQAHVGELGSQKGGESTALGWASRWFGGSTTSTSTAKPSTPTTPTPTQQTASTPSQSGAQSSSSSNKFDSNDYETSSPSFSSSSPSVVSAGGQKAKGMSLRTPSQQSTSFNEDTDSGWDDVKPVRKTATPSSKSKAHTIAFDDGWDVDASAWDDDARDTTAKGSTSTHSAVPYNESDFNDGWGDDQGDWDFDATPAATPSRIDARIQNQQQRTEGKRSVGSNR